MYDTQKYIKYLTQFFYTSFKNKNKNKTKRLVPDQDSLSKLSLFLTHKHTPDPKGWLHCSQDASE